LVQYFSLEDRSERQRTLVFIAENGKPSKISEEPEVMLGEAQYVGRTRQFD